MHFILFSKTSHLTPSALALLSSCSGIDVGCKWNGPSSQIDGHQSNCPFVLFRDFIQSTRVEIAALKTQLREQSHEIEFLRHHLGSPESGSSVSSSSNQDLGMTSRLSLPGLSTSPLAPATQAAAPVQQKTARQQIQEGVSNLQSQKTLLGHTRGVTSLVYDGSTC
jgi:hypothetical protein